MGRQADGQGLVGVIFEVSRECFDAVAVGVAWPPVGRQNLIRAALS